MSDADHARMTAGEFIAWAMEQPEGRHHELVTGEVIGIAPENSEPAWAKAHARQRKTEAAETAAVPCRVYRDGMAVAIDETRVYETDVLVRCGPLVPGNSIRVG